jgi:hypothetical protein
MQKVFAKGSLEEMELLTVFPTTASTVKDEIHSFL